MCPQVSQMKLRAEICKESLKYMCFLDMNKQTYQEYCNETDEIQQEGNANVFALKILTFIYNNEKNTFN